MYFQEWSKISYTTQKDKEKRLTAYKTCAPYGKYEFYDTFYFPDPEYIEKLVLKHYEGSKVETSGEWIKISPKEICKFLRINKLLE